jgi:hypothetical protein
LPGCARCRARLKTFEQALVEFAANAPALDLTNTAAPQPAAALGSARRKPTRRLLGAGVALAVAVAAGAWLALPFDRPGIRVKGGAHLDFYVKRADHVFEAGEGAQLRPADELRFRYSASERQWLAVLGVDASHRVGQYFPGDGGMRAIEAGDDVLLPEATRLDETLGDELVIGVFCAAERDLGPLIHRLQSDAALSPEPGCRLERIHITKTGQPRP